MARVKLKRKRFVVPEKYVLIVLTVLCVGLMILSYTTDAVSSLFSFAAGYTIIPFQNGLTKIGTGFNRRMEDLKEVKVVLSENAALKEEVARLEQKNNELTADRYELSRLRELFDLNMEYSDYNKIGARVTGKDPGNWYSVFVVDKGTEDGVKIDMNVIAGAGLVGIVTKVGPNWAQVRSIIDDESNVSGMVLSSADNLMVRGNLQSMKEGDIDFMQLNDSGDNVVVGDKVVTSDISDRYLPGISIGYISQIETDSNNLTKSGKLTPLVDFEHLDVVLIITELKEKAETE
jgi:rod shape-determining protein MreC